MAHHIEGNSVFAVGQPAWHGLGKTLHAPPSIEEAIVAAGLDWNVSLKPLQLTDDGRPVEHRAAVRESDGSILGVVGPKFVPLQNRAAFQWFAPFVESKLVTLEAAGSLYQGRRVWVLAKVSGGIVDVAPNDTITQYVLLAHAHDGTLSIHLGFTTVRVVCQNTLSASIRSKESKLLKIKHTQRAHFALEEIRAIMDTTTADFHATAEQFRFLARCGCDEKTLKRYVREVFAPEKADHEDAVKRIVGQVLPLFESGRGAELSRGTLWGAFNSVTEFVTHMQGRTPDARLDGQWFGEGAKLIERAKERALALAR
jgi:phage/plasmid-like protein (TIGR03299 family)